MAASLLLLPHLKQETDMRMITTLIALCLFAGAGHAQSTAPQTHELTGLWLFEISTARGMTRGAFALAPQPGGYRGMLMTDQGAHALPVRSLTLAGQALEMRVDSPQGEVVFRGSLDRNGRSFRGQVTYHDGRLMPMAGRRR